MVAMERNAKIRLEMMPTAVGAFLTGRQIKSPMHSPVLGLTLVGMKVRRRSKPYAERQAGRGPFATRSERDFLERANGHFNTINQMHVKPLRRLLRSCKWAAH